ncbi:unnamed protein product [Calicophoron daubneyi]|uniref:Uncharacterized protein n=1 Tax=Calicophoron daubneyi TaxID=300641 RepID=A0AAV2T873_CALDB
MIERLVGNEHGRHARIYAIRKTHNLLPLFAGIPSRKKLTLDAVTHFLRRRRRSQAKIVKLVRRLPTRKGIYNEVAVQTGNSVCARMYTPSYEVERVASVRLTTSDQSEENVLFSHTTVSDYFSQQSSEDSTSSRSRQKDPPFPTYLRIRSPTLPSDEDDDRITIISRQFTPIVPLRTSASTFASRRSRSLDYPTFTSGLSFE